MPIKFFHREFLAQPDDQNDDGAFVLARVREADADGASATIRINDGYGEAVLSFYLWGGKERDELDKDEAGKTLEKFAKFKSIMINFLDEAETQLKKVK